MLEFCSKYNKGNNQYNRILPNEVRNDEEIASLIRIQRTYVGKLAECVFLQYLANNNINYDAGDMFCIWKDKIM